MPYSVMLAVAENSIEMGSKNNEVKTELQASIEMNFYHLDLIQKQAESLQEAHGVIAELKSENEALKQSVKVLEKRIIIQRRSFRYRAGSSRCITSNRKRLAEHLSKFRRKRKGNNKNKKSEDPLAKLWTVNICYFTIRCEREIDVNDQEEERLNKMTFDAPGYHLTEPREPDPIDMPEDFSDAAYNKRHFPLVLNEKKSKRWDMQRLKENWQNERLRQKEEERLAKLLPVKPVLPVVTSFYSKTSDLGAVQVVEHLPVDFCSVPLTKEQFGCSGFKYNNEFSWDMIQNRTRRKGKR